MSLSKHPFIKWHTQLDTTQKDKERNETVQQSMKASDADSEAEMIFDIFDLLHHVADLLSLLSEDVLNDPLLMDVE